MIYSRYILTLIAVLCSVGLSAQGLSIQTKINRSEMKTGEQAIIDMTIRTNNLPQTEFYLKQDSSSQTEQFRVLFFGATDTLDVSGDLKEIQAKMVITSFDSTLIVIPPILVKTPKEEAESQPLALNVIQPKVDMEHPERFNGLKDVWDIPMTREEIIRIIFLVIGSIIAVILLIYLIRYIRNKRKQNPDTEEKVSILTPLEKLCISLDTLSTNTLQSQEDYKSYYTSIIDCLKLYVQEVKPWSLQELTSTEIATLFREQGLPIQLIQQFESISSEADIVKFAKGSSSQEYAIEVRELAKRFAIEFDSLVEHIDSTIKEKN